MTARRTDMHQLQEAVRLHRLGQSQRQVARQLRIGRDTLARYFLAFERASALAGDPDDLPDTSHPRTIAAEQIESKKAKQQTSSLEPTRDPDAPHSAPLGGILGLFQSVRHTPRTGTPSGLWNPASFGLARRQRGRLPE